MKKIYKITSLLALILILTACSQYLERASRTIELMQDSVTSIISLMQDIQNYERDIQEHFEATLNSDQGLEIFNQKDNPILDNTQARSQLLDKLEEASKQLVGLAEELGSQRDARNAPSQEIDQIVAVVSDLAEDLNRYIADYRTNLSLERQSYQAIGNPDIDFTNFFQVFDNIEVLSTNNFMNLEKVLTYFEPLNTHLINFKVYLANLQENRHR